jgi:hypothetical protein
MVSDASGLSAKPNGSFGPMMTWLGSPSKTTAGGVAGLQGGSAALGPGAVPGTAGVPGAGGAPGVGAGPAVGRCGKVSHAIPS